MLWLIVWKGGYKHSVHETELSAQMYLVFGGFVGAQVIALA